jgi:prevent-host-death family protein
MEIVNVHEAKTHLSRLLVKVASGEEIVIARNGEPIAKLVRYESKPKPRMLGQWKGQVWVSDDFDDEVDPLTWGLDEISD